MDKAFLQQEFTELKEKTAIIEVVQSKTVSASNKMGFSRSYSDNSYTQTTCRPSLEEAQTQSMDRGTGSDHIKQEVSQCMHV